MCHTFIPVCDSYEVIDIQCEKCGVSWDAAVERPVGCDREELPATTKNRYSDLVPRLPQPQAKVVV